MAIKNCTLFGRGPLPVLRTSPNRSEGGRRQFEADIGQYSNPPPAVHNTVVLVVQSKLSAR